MTSRAKPRPSAIPRWRRAADSLCRLIEYTPDATRIPLKLVDQHVDAVRAIYREYSRSDAKELAAMLTQRLREVTDEFLSTKTATGRTCSSRSRARRSCRNKRKSARNSLGR